MKNTENQEKYVEKLGKIVQKNQEKLKNKEKQKKLGKIPKVRKNTLKSQEKYQ